jgi:gliding motility-associated lipoprotein GldD
MRRTRRLSLAFVLLAIISCEEEYSPKPFGYHRIDLPEKVYVSRDFDCPFRFESLNQTIVQKRDEKDCWFNLHYPEYGATIHLSYQKIVSEELNTHIEDSRKLAMKHIVKADDIKEQFFSNEAKKVFGLIYDMEGNVASNYQFFLTDSSEHFFRGAMYFNMRPNADSLQPVIGFIKTDLQYLIESFEWKPVDGG